MLGDRDLNVLLSPLPRNKRAKNPLQETAKEQPADPPPQATDGADPASRARHQGSREPLP
jgi:hypothetical protein